MRWLDDLRQIRENLRPMPPLPTREQTHPNEGVPYWTEMPPLHPTMLRVDGWRGAEREWTMFCAFEPDAGLGGTGLSLRAAFGHARDVRERAASPEGQRIARKYAEAWDAFVASSGRPA